MEQEEQKHVDNQSQVINKPFPLPKIQKDQFGIYSQCDWHFLEQSTGTILKSTQAYDIQHYFNFQSSPDMIFGFSRLLIISPKHNFTYSLNPFDALNFCKYETQKQYLLSNLIAEQQETAPPAFDGDQQDKLLNSIDMRPKDIEVKESKLWKEKDVSKIEDLKTIEKTFDWSFSTPFKGTISSLSESLKENSTFNQQIESFNELIEQVVGPTELSQLPDFKGKLDYTSKTSIPLLLLGKDNPILHYGEVVLFEDELGDKGYSKCFVRYRVMKDCFFLLLRSYTRVDHVLVRILDTRIFHEFGSNVLIRDFIHKESTYEYLKIKEVDTSSKWSLSQTQSDDIYQNLEDRHHTNDQIVLS